MESILELRLSHCLVVATGCDFDRGGEATCTRLSYLRICVTTVQYLLKLMKLKIIDMEHALLFFLLYSTHNSRNVTILYFDATAGASYPSPRGMSQRA
jgi:hypothetical protein